jgi:hypothetical protein
MSVSVRPIVKIKLMETLKGWPYTDGQVYPFKQEAVSQLEESFKHELELRGATHVSYEIVDKTIEWTFEDGGHQCKCILTPFLWDRRLETKVEFVNL